MKIAVLGTRGIPTKQGGVERHVEELYQRIAKKHDVTVYCRNSYTDDDISEYKGMKLRRLPHLNTKHLDAITHTFLASIDSIFRRYDIVHFHSIGPSLLSFIPKIKRKAKIVSTVHAPDWQQSKWGYVAKKMLKLGERASVTFPDLTITVSKQVQKNLMKKYNHSCCLISNGVSEPIFRESDKIKKLLLENKKYILFVGRLIPNKNCHLLIRAFKNVETKFKLVIVGGSGHTDDYHKRLVDEAEGDDRIIFTGQTTGNLLNELYSNAYMFVLPSNLEGMPVVLLEAMSYGLPILCSDIKPNLDVVKANSAYATTFASDKQKDLENKIFTMINSTNGIFEKAQKAQKHVISKYDWDNIAEQTDKAYMGLFK